MICTTRSALLATLPLLAALGACGDAGGSLASAGSTAAPASYVKITDMTGNRTFQTAGVQYNTAPLTGASGATTLAFGSGVSVAYTAASDSYTLTAPDATTVTFDPSNVQPQTSANAVTYVKIVGTTRDQFTLSAPIVAGVALSYTVAGAWGHIDTTANTGVFRLAVGGAPTLASDMPKTGTASYATTLNGSASANTGGVPYTLAGTSSATFSANFATGAIATALTLVGTPLTGGAAVDFGTLTGAGTIAANSPGFTGTLTGPASGVFSGLFLGPQALEMGYDWAVAGGSFNAVGSVVGRKN